MSQMPSAKAIPSLWVQLPDIHQTQILFVRDKFSDGFMFMPVTTAPRMNTSRRSAKTTNLLAQAIPNYCTYGSFYNSSNAFGTQEWFNLPRYDVLRLRSTTPLAFWLVGSCGLLITLMMETIRTCETSVYSNQTTR
jgi:hypothetical protein